MNNKLIFRADSRGYANHGWLKSYHTFSFANYQNNERIHFGVLRVLNDDYVAPGMGFGTHPHENMEIISIPLNGSLSHKDSMGNGTIINTGEIQVMSAGTGINHSEFNPDETNASQFLQIWLFPNKLNVKPRYDQLKLNKEDRANQWDQILSPNPDDKGVWIHQNAWFHLTDLDQDRELRYELKDKSNGIFLFVLEGEISIEEDVLHRRDAIGFDEKESFSIKASKNSQVLLMEVPMELPAYLQ
ncbi:MULTISPECIES: pirin family protein [Myroides]|uniref:Pirin family protein n=1 Tax=Myroides albus TaxID=2562892 RepID=A0A6I3LGD5_9FLAO|nr:MULTISPECIES: pirin family protein [Myroides]MTG96947.1 pirin family protein [Myroides albus]MVX35360.1 pirin family protein [Myroides sp. LoEW2-1]UVD78302.1 pirin family protein [Myroides albus]